MHLVLIVLALSLLPALSADEPTEIYIRWSVKHPEKSQDWSGKATISEGEILKVKNDSGPMDKVRADGSWEIVYGRALRKNPKAKVGKKGLFLTVEAPHQDAEITVTTKGGDFSFRLDELKPKGIARLEGNVKIYPGKPGRRKRRRRPSLPPARVAGEIPTERMSDPAKQSEWPAIAYDSAGNLWSAYVEWNGKESDRVRVRRKTGNGQWSAPVALEDGNWDHYWPAVATTGNGAIVVWSAQKEGNFDLFWSKVSAEGKAARPKRLTTAPYTDFQARFAKAPNGDLCLAWQSFRNGRSDIYARWYRNGTWGRETRISSSESNDWQPDLACDSAGAAWICWDSYQPGNYDVFLRKFGPDGLGEVIPMTTEPSAQFHSTVAVDSENRVWVAWDDAGIHWGKDFSRASSIEGSRGLHYSRSLALRVFDGQKISEPEAPLASILTGRMTRYAELPRLGFDGSGTLWMVFRHWTSPRPTEIYHFYAARLTARGWEGPWRLKDSSGQNTMWADMARNPDGTLTVACAADRRSPENLPEDQVHALLYNAYVAQLPAGESAPNIALEEIKLPPLPAAETFSPRPTQTVDGKAYTLVMGDCHRHTDIRGHSGVDGSIMDTYRYALDAARLDYLGMGDHNEVFGGDWPDGLRDYQWWWAQKAADLFNTPPTFVGLYSYEHSMSSPAGHRNIIFLKRGAPLRRIDRRQAQDNQPPELWKWVRENVLTQPGQKCMIVPHTFAAGPLASWNWPNPEFDGLLEMYQGCRGSYEAWGLPPKEKRGPTQTSKKGHFAQDALNAGNRYGFVSFSDHSSTHNSFAAVWVNRVNRDNILTAMLARRTYAATDHIIMKVNAGPRMAGEAFEADAATPPVIDIDITAADNILRVDVVRNGEFLWTRRPTGRQFKASYQDAAPKAGDSYYYVRIFQRDPEKPDGDPEIAWSSPFFVKYR